MSYSSQYLAEARQILDHLDLEPIERMAHLLAETREKGGRLFILGVGGGAGHASSCRLNTHSMVRSLSVPPGPSKVLCPSYLMTSWFSMAIRIWISITKLRGGAFKPATSWA